VFGSDIVARVEAMVTMAPRALRSGFSAARANRKGGRQIGIDDLIPFGERQPPQRLADHDAGIGGDQRIEPAVSIEQGTDRARRRFLDADVAFDEHDVAGG
jgi:hypothetical protein